MVLSKNRSKWNKELNLKPEALIMLEGHITRFEEDIEQDIGIEENFPNGTVFAMYL